MGVGGFGVLELTMKKGAEIDEFFLFREVEGFDFEGVSQKRCGKEEVAGKQVAVNFYQLFPLQPGIFGCQKNGTFLCFPGGWKIEKRVAEFRVIDGLFLDAKKSSGKEMEGNGETLGIGKPFGDW